jgi:dipeptidyl aminopeptidase/acylaminoacyl peptidase
VKRLAALLIAAVVAPPAALAGPSLTFSRPEAFGGGVFTLASGSPRRIADGSSAAWSPDGRRIAVVAGDGAVLQTVDADGRYRAAIAVGPVASPDWSPDGRKLVFERFGWIHTIDADGTNERRIARGRSPAWSPGGRKIAFVSDRSGNDGIYAVRSTGGGLQQLTSGVGNESDPAWAPNGRRLAFVTDETGPTEVALFDTASRKIAPLSRDLAVTAAPAWSPDGKRIAYVSSRDGDDAVWSLPAVGGAPRRVASGPAARPRWQPSPQVQELLPDLDQQPPTDLDVRSSHGRHRLWFTAATDNVGIGPLIVSGLRPQASLLMPALQRVRLSDGGTRTYPRVGLWRYNYSPDHSHWHFLYYQRYELRRQDGSVLVRDRKSGFCLGDRYGVAGGRLLNRVSSPVFTGFCNRYEPGSTSVDGGTSVGFSDRYHSGLDGQNVDITNVPAGEYTLVHRTNTQLLIRELRYTNNASSAAIRLTWPRGRSNPPAVRVLRVCPDSDRCS